MESLLSLAANKRRVTTFFICVFRNVLVDVLEDGKLFNYNVFAQKGHGLAFTSDLARESIIVYIKVYTLRVT